MPVNGTSIEDDLRRRDFTINAMALNVSTGTLIDRLGGQQDLAAKKVRMVSGDVFRKDPVRLIRAFRLSAEFEFTIEADTKATIRRDANLIKKSAGERIREEFFKILKQNNSYNVLSGMAHSGLMFFVIPEASKINSGSDRDRCTARGNSGHSIFILSSGGFFEYPRSIYPVYQQATFVCDRFAPGDAFKICCRLDAIAPTGSAQGTHMRSSSLFRPMSSNRDAIARATETLPTLAMFPQRNGLY